MRSSDPPHLAVQPVVVPDGPASTAARSGHLRFSQRRAAGLLVLADLAALYLSLAAAVAVGWLDGVRPSAALLTAVTCVVVLIAAGGLYGLRSEAATDPDRQTAADIPGLFHVALLVACSGALVIYLREDVVPVGPTVLLGAVLLLSLTLMRGLVRTVSARLGDSVQRILIVGGGDVARALGRSLRTRPVHGYDLVGYVDDGTLPPLARRITLPAGAPRLGEVAELPGIVEAHRIDRVIVAFGRQTHAHTAALLRALTHVRVPVDVVPRLFDLSGPTARLHWIDGLPVLTHSRRSDARGARAVKRGIDILVAGLALLVLWPLLAFIALAVKLDSPGPVLYLSPRPGRGGQRFGLWKFRTMSVEHCVGERYGGDSAEAAFAALLENDPEARRAYAATHKLANDPRVTRVGRWLRRSSLDELPQLVNILRGQLSLVGPRPITLEEIPRYGSDLDELLSVRPGLTGLWQVSGRSALPYDQRKRLELAYVREWSLRLDLRILLHTPALFTRRTQAG